MNRRIHDSMRTPAHARIGGARAFALLLASLAAGAIACGGDERPVAESGDGGATPKAAAAVTTPNGAASTDAADSANAVSAASAARPAANAAPDPVPAVEIVHLTPEQLAAAEIALGVAGPGPVDSGFELVGEVHPNGDRLAHITPRFPGIVREVRKNAGDAVAAGDVLAVIESSDSLAPYAVKTAIDGIVIGKDLTRGEAVERTKQAFVVADLATVWVDLAIYQKDLGRIPLGQRVHIDAVGPGPAAEGRISYITPAVDRVTRTATARVVLANGDRQFLPGMFVTAHTLDVVDAAVTVPRDAIQTIGDAPRVFVFIEGKGADGLAARKVVLGRQGTERVEIVSGLAAGERIAVSNAFLLKAELARAAGGEED